MLKIPVSEQHQLDEPKSKPEPSRPIESTPEDSKVIKVDDFFAQIDLGIKSSKSRLDKVDVSGVLV